MSRRPENDYEAYARRRRAQRRRNAQHGHYARGNPSLVSKRGLPMWAMALLGLGAVGALGFVVMLAAGFMVYDSYASDLVPPDELAINQPSYGAIILDRNDNVLYEYVDDKAGLRRPTPIEAIAPAFLAATISTEDDSFFTNPGVNFQGLARAAWENSPFGGDGLFGGSGGSSITQQLVKSVYVDEDARQERWSEDGINRKVKEMVYALELTEHYEKSRILEWYVNQISYGGVFNGVEAASLGYFGKNAGDLTLGEAALLAGIPQSPAAYDPVNNPEAATARRNAILDLMLQQSPIQIGEDEFFSVTPAEVAAAKAEEINITDAQFEIDAPHWVLSYVEPQLREMLGCPSLLEMQIEVQEGTRDLLKGRPGEGCEALFTEGLIVKTTLDLELQNRTQEIMEKWILEYEAQSGTHNGSMMVMDPHSGEILVMLGSRDYKRDDIDGRNNNAIACNSPGSAFKPFAFLSAFENLGWGPGTYMLDTPVSFPNGTNDPFVPRNPLGDFAGPVTIRNALGNSLNIPANKAAAAVGSQEVVVTARQVGFVDTFRLDGCSGAGGYGPAIATGGVDVTLEEMMYGYSTLAAGGLMRGQEPIEAHDADERQADPVSILKIVDNLGEVRWDIEEKQKEMRVVEEGYSYLLWDILTDSNARCRTFGCGLNVDGYKVAVKTGTSEPYPDDHPTCARKIGETWAFGYSPDLVVGIWAGNSDNTCLQDLTSATLAFRAMSEAFQMAHEGRPVTEYVQPESVEMAEVCLPSGLKPTDLCGSTTRDLFVKGDIPTAEDTWWQEVTLDTRNGKLASDTTPEQYQEKKVMLVLPASWHSGGASEEEDAQRSQAEMWASALGIALAPTEVSELKPGDRPEGEEEEDGDQQSSEEADIFSPTDGSDVENLVQILGRAAVDDFESYRIEFAEGSGSDADEWVTINEGSSQQPGGILGLWNVSGLDEGAYTVRLIVEDEDGEEYITSVTVNVGE